MTFLDDLITEIDRLPVQKRQGRVSSVKGLLVECSGIEAYLSVGTRCTITGRNVKINAEVVGFRDERALLMPFGSLDGVGLGSIVEITDSEAVVYPSEAWLGRIVNAFGEPLDGLGVLPKGSRACGYYNSPPPAHKRNRVGAKLDMGVRAMNTFLTMCDGQRMGIFAGSGVGKSTLMSMFAKFSTADINVIGLIGERGREVQEFIQDDLGEEGLKRSVIIVATSDEPALMRKQAAYLTLTVAEYFRDHGNKVLCLMDSVTRFAMAQREIGLSAGEPPTTKGYPPSVFAELPRLLERAGPGTDAGGISGFFTVLVDGDDHNEPIADAVRGILDGHIVLDRSIGERGRYPAINILRSVSRTMPDCNTELQNQLVKRARRLLSTYNDMAEMIRLGAYRKGSNPEVDEAIYYFPKLEAFLSQLQEESTDLETGYAMLAEILGVSYES
jgi:flagellum-specific ATP synthase